MGSVILRLPPVPHPVACGFHIRLQTARGDTTLGLWKTGADSYLGQDEVVRDKPAITSAPTVTAARMAAPRLKRLSGLVFISTSGKIVERASFFDSR